MKTAQLSGLKSPETHEVKVMLSDVKKRRADPHAKRILRLIGEDNLLRLSDSTMVTYKINFGDEDNSTIDIPRPVYKQRVNFSFFNN